MSKLSVDELMERAFCNGRDPRSAMYKQGCRALLSRRIDGVPVVCPYTAGSPEFDAFWAGVDEAWIIVAREKSRGSTI